jgi:hypothetical protein
MHKNKGNSVTNIYGFSSECVYKEDLVRRRNLALCSPAQLFDLQKHLKDISFTPKQYKEYNF